MEEDLKKIRMKDNLKKMEDNLKKNGRQPQQKLQIKDDLNFFFEKQE